MNSALFGKLTLASLLTLAVMAACGGDAASTDASGQQGACTAPFLQCTCPTGGPGYQTCQGGQLSPCTCTGQMGSGGGNPVGGAVCGNGVIEAGEMCDGQAQNGETCATFTMGACTGGFLVCNGTCQFDTSQCTGCGTVGTGGAGGTFGGAGGFPTGGTTGQP